MIDAANSGLEDLIGHSYSIAPFPSSFLLPSAVTALFLRRATPLRPLAVACATLALLCASGCVQRRITIRSNPPGALVYIDTYEIGKTPCSVGYIYYGTRQIKLVKDGYETLTLMQWIPPPWYQIPPLDFVAENVVPAEIRDERTYTYQLVPTRMVPTNQLLGRAENLRQATRLENIAAGPPAPRPRRQPAPLIPVAPPPGSGSVLQPGALPSGPDPGPGPNIYPAPGVYFPPGTYPGGFGQPGYAAPGMMPAPGPLPPRGPQ